MSMFDSDEMSDNDKDLKDSILQALIEKMEDVMSGRMAPAKPEHDGMAVQVEAPDKDSLKEGLMKASDVLDKVPAAMGDEDDNKSDDERLAELMDGDSSSGDDDKEEDDEDKMKR